MKIILVSDAIPPIINGVTTLLATTANTLTDMGHEVLVICAKPKELSLRPPFKKAKTVQYRSIPAMIYPKFRIALPNPIKTASVISRFQPDIIHSFSPSPLAVDYLLSANLLKVPYVSTYTTQLNNKQYIQIAIKTNQVEHIEGIIEMYFKWFYSKCNVVLSEAKSMVPNMVDAGVPEDKIVVSPSPSDLSSIRILNDAEKKTLWQKYGVKRISAVYLGRLSIEKNLTTLINIWKEVTKALPEAVLAIIGEGKEEGNLKKLIKDLQLDKNVLFVGSTSHDDLMKSGFLSASDIFVSASTSETLGLAAIEGMASGIPPVLFDATGVSDSITDQGFIVEKDNAEKFVDAIIKLLKDPNTRKIMGEKAKVFSEFYDSNNAVNRFLSVYSNISKK